MPLTKHAYDPHSGTCDVMRYIPGETMLQRSILQTRTDIEWAIDDAKQLLEDDPTDERANAALNKGYKLLRRIQRIEQEAPDDRSAEEILSQFEVLDEDDYKEVSDGIIYCHICSDYDVCYHAAQARIEEIADWLVNAHDDKHRALAQVFNYWPNSTDRTVADASLARFIDRYNLWTDPPTYIVDQAYMIFFPNSVSEQTAPTEAA